MTLRSVLPTLSTLLSHPNTVSTFNGNAADLFRASPRLYWAHVYLTHERNMNERPKAD